MKLAVPTQCSLDLIVQFTRPIIRYPLQRLTGVHRVTVRG